MFARRILAVLLLLTAALLWAIPSDVVELIVRQRGVVLGRYSESHAYVAILLSPLLAGQHFAGAGFFPYADC